VTKEIMTYNKLRKGRLSESGREYLVTAVTHDRQCFFADIIAARLLVKELRHAQD
jgi:putative transposase